MHSIEKFTHVFPDIRIIIVLPEDQLYHWEKLCHKHQFSLKHNVISGGPERFHSVKRGLTLVQDSQVIAIHDGIRPLVSENTIIRVFNEAEKYGSAIPCLPVKESAREIIGNTSKPLNRSLIRIIQTPQGFTHDIILNAYRQSYRKEFTDDAMVVESSGVRIHLVEGNPENIKITTPLDLIIASAIIKS